MGAIGRKVDRNLKFRFLNELKKAIPSGAESLKSRIERKLFEAASCAKRGLSSDLLNQRDGPLRSRI
jgi:hypothetical protein